MGAITIRGLNDAVVAAIKQRAGDHGVSMEEEIRRLLHLTYADDRDKGGRIWAKRQLVRLQRGELPTSGGSSVDIIRDMRRERTDRVMRTTGAARGRRR